MAVDVQWRDHNIFQKSLIVYQVSGDYQGVASYQLAFQYADQRSNVEDRDVVLLLMHRTLYILLQVSLHQIFHAQPYQDICQIIGMKNLLHSCFLSLQFW